ncbi:uncharacterized protein TRIADDRAFT_50205 [Trichoplax adhaerens]|uniref:MIP18 family-like domain-containing protein n=1 Tax=Trichoplax adhaerens TaxID=10228 RepID=B3RVK4_TRIAD|nr:hypothetical protein TRIADDRAFT_50205 [Trichoplax adhaerens]EDV26012.1 hypothetical protein TRIADDRAFT_50205 [Trichoplax adhaerens]|eukprot:XP_002112045.1 hypothetical protein TRIADDRAFT_50205 [Trichoplax adhaerens]
MSKFSSAIGLENINPTVFSKSKEREILPEELDDNIYEELNVVEECKIDVDDDNNFVKVHFTPTIPHCSMATLIGLCIRVRLIRSLPERFKVDITVTPGSHSSEIAVNKQLADKERVAAAMENSNLLKVVNQCLAMD